MNTSTRYTPLKASSAGTGALDTIPPLNAVISTLDAQTEARNCGAGQPQSRLISSGHVQYHTPNSSRGLSTKLATNSFQSQLSTRVVHISGKTFHNSGSSDHTAAD